VSGNFLVGDRNLTPADASVALVVLDDGRYLMQLRSERPGIFYPGHWGLFGGALDAGEDFDTALLLELKVELGHDIGGGRYFTEFTFDFSFRGMGKMVRRYFEVTLPAARLGELVLGEGSAMKAFAARDVLSQERVVPYDAFAVWLHATRPQ
jgi:8-oxo-dGTP pyrophosphatase MutT (NUDIX family)